MTIRVDDELLGYMRESSGAIHFEVRGASDTETVVRALRQARRELFSIPHPEEPSDPYAAFASDVEPTPRGHGFWVDMADAEAYEGVLEDAFQRVLVALAENGVEDACLTWPASDCRRASAWRKEQARGRRVEDVVDDSPLEAPQPTGVPGAVTTGWSRCAPIPSVRSSLAATVGPDGRIYAIGGENRRGGQAKTVEAYDPASDAWSREAPLQIGRRGPGAALGEDGRIYAIGGHGGERGGTRVPDIVITVEAYEPSERRWEHVAPIRAPALNHIGAATGRDGRIYALAPTSAAGLPDDVFNAYDPESESWVALRPANGLGYRSGSRPWLVAGGDGRIYATGGTTFEGTVIVQVYDPESDVWEEVKSPERRRGSFSAAGDAEGRIHLVGGHALDDSAVCPGEAYKPATDRWEGVEPLLRERSSLTAAAGVGGVIFALGGYVGRALVGDLDVYHR